MSARVPVDGVADDREAARAELAATARRMLTAAGGTRVARAAYAGESSSAANLWAELGKLGWLAIDLPEPHGGGGEFADVAVLLHEFGRTVLPVPALGELVVGRAALLLASHEARAWHEAAARGAGRITAGLGVDRGEVYGPGVTAVRGTRSYTLNGTTEFVPDLMDAAYVVVECADPAGCRVVVAVDTSAPGVSMTGQDLIDRTRAFGTLNLRDVAVDDDAVIAKGLVADRLVDEVADRAAVAIAVDCVAGAERVLELTVEHLKQREQFGRPLASFQALKHRATAMFLQVESARAAVTHAVTALADPVQRRVATSIAKSLAGDAFAFVAAEGVQLHGGIGFTWEHDMHMFLKRAKLNELLYGDAAWHRDRIARIALD